LFKKRPVVPPRQPHANPVVDSHLRTIDLLRERVRHIEERISGCYNSIAESRDAARRNPYRTEEHLAVINNALDDVAELETQLENLMKDIDERQKEAEAAEQRWLDQVKK
jgi:chromosome segregation ATPase